MNKNMNKNMNKYGDGAFYPIKNSPGWYYFRMPMGHGVRSPRFRCKNIQQGRRLYVKWQVEHLAEVERLALQSARGLAEQRTVRHYLETHWEAVKSNLAETTRALHQSTLNVHIFKDSQFCAIDYYELQAADVQAFLGRIDGSDNTRARVYKFLRSSFQAAVDERLLPVNPIHIAKGKKPKSNPSAVFSMTPEDEVKLVQFVHGDEKWYPLVIFALDTGCRQSEILGLRWDCVNFDSREVHIRRTLHTVNGEVVLKDTVKTDASRRTIRVARCTLDGLDALRRHSTGHSGYVFSDDGGAPITRHAFSKRWLKLLSKAGLPHHGFHALRHTCATRLLRGGSFLTAVAARLGHAKPSMTLDLYSDAIPNDQHPLADAFDATVASALPNRSTNGSK